MRSSRTLPCTRRRAFTLIELLIVIVIIGLLAAMLVPSVMSALREAQIVQCKANLKQIATAVISYTTDNQGTIPPTRLKTEGDQYLYWCNLLARRDLPAQNMASADADTPRATRTVLICPAAELDQVSLEENAASLAGAEPDWDIVQGWFRVGNDDRKTDCSYYWNGYVGTNSAHRRRFPSLSVDPDDPQTGMGKFDYHNISEISHRSEMAMITDGVFWQNEEANRLGCIAARHHGSEGPRRSTNIAFYDCHVETMDRTPGGADDEDWTQEEVVHSETGLIPIYGRSEEPDELLEGGPPFFLLPKR